MNLRGIWQLSVKCSSFLFSRAIRSRERASLRCDRNVRRFSLVCSDELRSCSATVAPRNFAGFFKCRKPTLFAFVFKPQRSFRANEIRAKFKAHVNRNIKDQQIKLYLFFTPLYFVNETTVCFFCFKPATANEYVKCANLKLKTNL